MSSLARTFAGRGPHPAPRGTPASAQALPACPCPQGWGVVANANKNLNPGPRFPLELFISNPSTIFVNVALKSFHKSECTLTTPTPQSLSNLTNLLIAWCHFLGSGTSKQFSQPHGLSCTCRADGGRPNVTDPTKCLRRRPGRRARGPAPGVAAPGGGGGAHPRRHPPPQGGRHGPRAGRCLRGGPLRSVDPKASPPLLPTTSPARPLVQVIPLPFVGVRLFDHSFGCGPIKSQWCTQTVSCAKQIVPGQTFGHFFGGPQRQSIFPPEPFRLTYPQEVVIREVDGTWGQGRI